MHLFKIFSLHIGTIFDRYVLYNSLLPINIYTIIISYFTKTILCSRVLHNIFTGRFKAKPPECFFKITVLTTFSACRSRSYQCSKASVAPHFYLCMSDASANRVHPLYEKMAAFSS